MHKRSDNLSLEWLGLTDYNQTLSRMQLYTQTRSSTDPDRIWVTEHAPVYTLGLNGNPSHLLKSNGIPVVSCDRGGQITYHGPGQLVIYFLLNLKPLGWGPRALVSLMENAVIGVLSQYGLTAQSRPDAPGVYIDQRKIASVGLRIRSGYCYHGLSLNNQMDLSPFLDINPCGYSGLEVTQLSDYGIHVRPEELAIPILHTVLSSIDET